MAKSFNFKVHSDVMYALDKYNKLNSGKNLSTLDGNILCLAKSFYESKNKLYMSNNELGKLLLAGSKTIQRSIDRLIEAGLLTKEIEYVQHKKRRYLIYNAHAVQKLTKEITDLT